MPVLAASNLPRVRPARIGALSVAAVVGRRWFRGAKWIRLAFMSVPAFALLAPRSPRLALGMAFLIAMTIANARRISGDAPIRLFERSTPALWRPSPLLLITLLLAATTAIPLSPLLLELPGARSLHIVVGILCAALWLTWSCASVPRPLLGISVYALVWYLESFSELPAAADLLGFGGTSVPSFATALTVMIALCVLVLRRDFYAFRSSRYL